MAPPKPVLSLSITASPERCRRANHVNEWVRTINFLGAFSHTCPKGARITDTNTFHWGKWEHCFAWPWFEKPTSGAASRRLCHQSLSNVRTKHTRRVKPASDRRDTRVTSVLQVTKLSEQCFKLLEDPLSKSGAIRLLIEVCSIQFILLVWLESKCLCLFCEWASSPLTDRMVFLLSRDRAADICWYNGPLGA